MIWFSKINSEAFKDWIIAIGSGNAIRPGKPLDPFGSSMRKFNNAHTWMKQVSDNGTLNLPTPRATDQARIDLRSSHLLDSNSIQLTALGKLTYNDLEKFGIPDGDANYEIHRCLILLKNSLKLKDKLYKGFADYWRELRQSYSFNHLISTPEHLYFFSYFNKNNNNYNPYDVIKGLNMNDADFPGRIDWNVVKDYYNNRQVDTAADNFKRAIDGIVSRQGRTNFVTALEIITNPSEAQTTISNLSINQSLKDILENISKELSNIYNMALNQILYGPPGTGKTHNAINHALSIVTGRDVSEIISEQKANPAKRVEAKQEFDKLVTAGQIQFVTFHQSYSYEDFVEGIKSAVNSNGQVEYRIEDGIFKKICNEAKKADNSDKNYILIIDEINRGNISKIFGELITLIEKSKRVGEAEEIKVKLTYSGIDCEEDFGVPNNLFILGTMNSADKSIALVDTALRRRFEFIEYAPDHTLLNNNIEGIDLQKLLETINARIQILLDKDHMIGHAYLINVESKNQLCKVFRNRIIPLLEEYFYGDYEKIQLVLGDNNEFNKAKENKVVVSNPTSDQRNLFGKDIDGFEEKTIYQLNGNILFQKYDDVSVEFFTSIYTKTKIN
ncbi:McrB family protein [Parabacteroides sp. FAFU027]|uniref:McrB family protein n=1 Tax=Parabacteroides sp. FAFU027 TaxID=2922715 RepID=UPI001FB03134|nr:AAA family ATPase [Parabacteroides sp. FAFU027]